MLLSESFIYIGFYLVSELFYAIGILDVFATPLTTKLKKRGNSLASFKRKRAGSFGNLIKKKFNFVLKQNIIKTRSEAEYMS